MSQKALEDRSGIPKSRLSRYENGHLLPSMAGLRRLAESLGVADSVLLGESDETYATFIRTLQERGITFSTSDEATAAANEIADILHAGTMPRSRYSRS